jgi:hypothetical protein
MINLNNNNIHIKYKYLIIIKITISYRIKERDQKRNDVNIESECGEYALDNMLVVLTQKPSLETIAVLDKSNKFVWIIIGNSIYSINFTKTCLSIIIKITNFNRIRFERGRKRNDVYWTQVWKTEPTYLHGIYHWSDCYDIGAIDSYLSCIFPAWWLILVEELKYFNTTPDTVIDYASTCFLNFLWTVILDNFSILFNSNFYQFY